MNYLHLNSTSIPPQPPGGVIAKRIEFDRHIETQRIEWFIDGTEPGSIELNTNHGSAHITYPPNGTIIALDPDIPEDRQLLFFEAQPDYAGFDWMLNNKRIGVSNVRVSWKPKRGKYILSLVDKGNRVIDSIGFEVR
jgi:penicillin-binding protein 1C